MISSDPVFSSGSSTQTRNIRPRANTVEVLGDADAAAVRRMPTTGVTRSAVGDDARSCNLDLDALLLKGGGLTVFDSLELAARILELFFGGVMHPLKCVS